jgi:hypothetical protein
MRWLRKVGNLFSIQNYHKACLSCYPFYKPTKNQKRSWSADTAQKLQSQLSETMGTPGVPNTGVTETPRQEGNRENKTNGAQSSPDCHKTFLGKLNRERDTEGASTKSTFEKMPTSPRKTRLHLSSAQGQLLVARLCPRETEVTFKQVLSSCPTQAPLYTSPCKSSSPPRLVPSPS